MVHDHQGIKFQGISLDFFWPGFFAKTETTLETSTQPNWLAVSTPLKNIRQIWSSFPQVVSPTAGVARKLSVKLFDRLLHFWQHRKEEQQIWQWKISAMIKIRYNTIDICQVLVNNFSAKLHGPPNKNPPQENHRHFKWPPTTKNGIKYVWSKYYMLIFCWYRSILWSSILKTFHGKRKQTHWYPIVSPWSHIPANSPGIFPDRPFLRPMCEVSWLLPLEPRSKCPSWFFKLKRNEAQWKWKKVFPSPKMLSTSTKTSSNGRWVSKKRLAACAKGAIKMFIAMLGLTSPNLLTCVHFMEGKECACG